MARSDKQAQAGWRHPLRHALAFLDNVWLQRIGAAILVASLVGGFVKILASSFPTSLLILAMVGAFLLTAGLTGAMFGRSPATADVLPPPPETAAPALTPPAVESPTERQRKVRTAKARLADEVEYIRGRIDEDDWHWWRTHKLPRAQWDAWGDYLAIHAFHSAHEALREVYRLSDSLTYQVTQNSIGGWSGSVAKWDKAIALRAACEKALVELNRVVP